MDLDFYKLQTSGNDLILVNFSGKTLPDEALLSEISESICRRDYGIGGNGLIIVKTFSSDSISAFFIDPTGKFKNPSFDAAICLSRYVFDTGMSGNNDFKLTINGMVHKVGIVDSNHFRISLGFPLDEEGIAFVENPDADYLRYITASGRQYPITVLNLQKEGIVIFSENRNLSQLKETADEILKTSGVPLNSRLVFATVNSRDELVVHIRNSRGDDFTSSCAIAAAASVVNGFLDRNATVFHKQGEFFFQWLQPSNEIFMTGSADYVYTGSIFIDDNGD
jgi:diaminopimelate epimerase